MKTHRINVKKENGELLSSYEMISQEHAEIAILVMQRTDKQINVHFDYEIVKISLS